MKSSLSHPKSKLGTVLLTLMVVFFSIFSFSGNVRAEVNAPKAKQTEQVISAKSRIPKRTVRLESAVVCVSSPTFSNWLAAIFSYDRLVNVKFAITSKWSHQCIPHRFLLPKTIPSNATDHVPFLAG